MMLVGITGVVALLPIRSATARPSSGSFSLPMGADADGAAAGSDSFGDAKSLGSMHGATLTQSVVGIASTRSGNGYWLVARDGGIFAFGDAPFFGSTGAMRLNQPIVGIASTPSGNGYWFVASDGGVFTFGDAGFFGSTGAIRLNQPIVGMAATPSGRGYWLVARDGGIFTFGDAGFLGSTGGVLPNQPIVGMAATPSGAGYRLVSSDGSVYPFGDGSALGSAAGRSGQPVVAIAPAAGGYWLPASDGAVFAFGTAPTFGAARATSPVVGIAATPSGGGYWLATADGSVLTSAAPPAPAAPAPAAPAPTPAAGGSSYAFLRIGKDGGPVRYDPCTDQHYVVNPASAPAGGVDEVKAAFQRLSAATGVHFVYDGPTTETHVPFGQRKTYQPSVYGDRWAPILISWSNESAEPLLAGGTIGYGGSTSYWSGSSNEAFVTGEVVLDTADTALHPGLGAGLSRGNLITHELGHVAGLDHVQDRGQLMYPSISSGTPEGYGPGDLAGLAQLGSSHGCLTVARPPH
ncbi:MAG: hypothetical protein QOI47_2565 [Actinomycetota bacterium]|nr:hypothetical protein [Actinomycetota bacterium]